VIRSVRAFTLGGSTPPEVASARGSFGERRGVLLELRDADGSLAFGEASPLPGFSPETLEDVIDRVSRFSWASLAVPMDLGAVVGERSLAFAIESALLSLGALRAGCSIAFWLSGEDPPPIPCSVLAGSLSDGQLLERASQAISRGATSIKVKANAVEARSSRARLFELRERVGPRAEIRVDFNGTLAVLSESEMMDLFAALAQLNVAFVEEPVSGPALGALGKLAVPWFADESLVDAGQRDVLLLGSAVAGVVLKPSLLGLFGAWNLALQASKRGIGVVVTHAFEGGVGLAAVAELALAVSTLPTSRAPGIDRHAALSRFGVPSPPQLAEGACIGVSSTEARAAFTRAVAGRIAGERPFFEWTR
jgi:L-alanine-DL-glutamate epimerase-like enolase superfamily enzyme